MLGLLHLFALLIPLGHAVFVLYQDRPQARAWLCTVAIASLPALPIIALAVRQQDQLNWVTKPDENAAGDLAGWLAGSELSIGPASVLIGLFLGGRSGRNRLAWLAVPWLLLPPIVLLLGSELKPVYVRRYLAFCLPALALLVGAGLAGTTVAPSVLGVLLLAILGLPTQIAIRQVGGHDDDIRDATTIVWQLARPGDGVLFNCPSCHYPDMPREFAFVCPQAFAGLVDVTMDASPSASDTLRDTDLDQARLAGIPRVLVIDVDGDAEPGALRDSGWRLVTERRAGNIVIEDYERS